MWINTASIREGLRSCLHRFYRGGWASVKLVWEDSLWHCRNPGSPLGAGHWDRRMRGRALGSSLALPLSFVILHESLSPSSKLRGCSKLLLGSCVLCTMVAAPDTKGKSDEFLILRSCAVTGITVTLPFVLETGPGSPKARKRWQQAAGLWSWLAGWQGLFSSVHFSFLLFFYQ